MQFHEPNRAEQKIKSLSERLKYIGRNRTLQYNHLSQGIKTENLTHNISLILSHIILNLSLVDKTPDLILRIITDYNKQNSASVFTTWDTKDVNGMKWRAKAIR